jgi:hypothetical protein
MNLRWLDDATQDPFEVEPLPHAGWRAPALLVEFASGIVSDGSQKTHPDHASLISLQVSMVALVALVLEA